MEQRRYQLITSSRVPNNRSSIFARSDDPRMPLCKMNLVHFVFVFESRRNLPPRICVPQDNREILAGRCHLLTVGAKGCMQYAISVKEGRSDSRASMRVPKLGGAFLQRQGVIGRSDQHGLAAGTLTSARQAGVDVMSRHGDVASMHFADARRPAAGAR